MINNLDLNQYKIRINTSIGDIKTPYGNFEKQFEYGNGQKTIEIRTTTGDIILK